MSFSNKLAIQEYLSTGQPLTELESAVLFGQPSLTALLSRLRKEGWVIKSQRTTYAAALKRINEYAQLTPPDNLPIREIMLTEWWINQ
jgi:hypothetical protein